jgi:hypothetical protein
MNKWMLIAGAGIMLAACDNAQVVTNVDTRKLTYTQDARTSLCFAVVGRADDAIGMRAASLSFTHVPCTPEVLALVRRG